MVRQAPSGPAFTQMGLEPGVVPGAGSGAEPDGAEPDGAEPDGAEPDGAAAPGAVGAAAGAGVGSACSLRVEPRAGAGAGAAAAACPAVLIAVGPGRAGRAGRRESARAARPRLGGRRAAGPAPRPGRVPRGGGPAARPCGEPAPAEVNDWASVPGGGRTRIETVDKSRNAIAPPESTMTGTVLPAGCRRKTAPARPGGGPDPVGEQRDRQLRGGQPRAMTHPGRQAEPAQRRPALREGQAGQQIERGSAAVTVGRGV